jgi:hypothetical protein
MKFHIRFREPRPLFAQRFANKNTAPGRARSYEDSPLRDDTGSIRRDVAKYRF